MFDIETLGRPVESFDERQRQYLFASQGGDAAAPATEEASKLALSPLTAEVLAIGMLNPDTTRGRVLYRSPSNTGGRGQGGAAELTAPAGGDIDFVECDEPTMLTEFWNDLARYDQFITFNGRTFDGPFLMIRSAILGIKPSRNLVPYRYSSSPHCDLLDQITFYGAARKYPLDFYCRSFGIPSPKDGGISGADCGPLYREGRGREVAEYCLGDVIATAELYRRWKRYLAVS